MLYVVVFMFPLSLSLSLNLASSLTPSPSPSPFLADQREDREVETLFWITTKSTRKVDVRLPSKGNSTSHVARPVHQIVTMTRWIRTRLSMKKKKALSRWVQVFNFAV